MAVVIMISTISFAVLTQTSSYTFARNDCSTHDNAVCAQSDLSLPVPSVNDIAAPGLQQEPGDQPRDAGEDSSGQDDDSEDDSISIDGSTFLLPFP